MNKKLYEGLDIFFSDDKERHRLLNSITSGTVFQINNMSRKLNLRVLLCKELLFAAKEKNIHHIKNVDTHLLPRVDGNSFVTFQLGLKHRGKLKKIVWSI